MTKKYEKTRKAMFGDREIITPNRNTLVEQTWNLNKQAILVTYDLLPRYDEVGLSYWKPFRPRLDKNLELILNESGYSKDRVDYHTYLNHGELIILDSKENRREAVKHNKEKGKIRENYSLANRLTYTAAEEEKLTPEILRMKAIERINLKKALTPGYTGMMWRRISNKQQNIIHLTEIMEGIKLYLKSEIDSKYYGKPETIEKFGISVLSRVPRTNFEGNHLVRMDQIPYTRRSYRWFDFRTEHSCAIKTTEFCFERKEKKNVICRHEIAGIYALMEKIVAAKRRKVTKGELHPREIMPNQIIPLPTDELINFYMKLRKRVRIVEPKLQRRNVVNRTRPLNSAEIEKLCWEAVTRYGHNKTLWRKRKLRNYNYLDL